MKKIISAALFVAACGGTKTPLPDATPEKLPLEMCADFRNAICLITAKCTKMNMDECIGMVDTECAKVTSVPDVKRLYEGCLPDLSKLTCDKLELPKSCEEVFVRVL